ncbi:tubulin-specific chaperone E-like isoform X2 [Watersipora subatra]
MIAEQMTCSEAIKDKYGKIEDGSTGIDEAQACLTQASKSRIINIEVVGMQKIGDLLSRFDQLRMVNVARMGIWGEPDSDALGELIPLADELNLSNNLLKTWKDVGDIIKPLPLLTCLHLSGNRLVYRDLERVERTGFDRLKRLKLMDMNLIWEEVVACSHLWIQISELHLCKNRIEKITTSPNFQSLKLLDLAENSLRSWANVKPFAQLPKLKELLVYDCDLSDISVEPGDFPSLRALDLAINCISEWRHISELNKLPSLTELMFKSNPVLEGEDVETNRQLVIAKIPHLKKYNRTDIDAKERQGAEIDYSKRFGEEWMLCGASLEVTESNRQFYAEHPTYLPIITKWGAPEKTEVKQSKPKSAIKESLIELTFIDLVTESGKEVSKYIPYTMNVVKCRNLAMKLLGIKGIPSVITYRSHQNGEEYDFDYDLRQLTFYNVQHGDEILLRQIP